MKTVVLIDGIKFFESDDFSDDSVFTISLCSEKVINFLKTNGIIKGDVE